MKIVVLGAAGNVGSRFARQAVAAGHEVVAYVRRPEAAPAGTEVVVGSAEDVETLASAAQGADVLVVSITGSIRDTSFMQRLQPGIIEAARRAQVKRVVLVSVFGAGETRAKASGFARLIYNTALRGFLADKAGTQLDHRLPRQPQGRPGAAVADGESTRRGEPGARHADTADGQRRHRTTGGRDRPGHHREAPADHHAHRVALTAKSVTQRSFDETHNI